MFRKDLVSFLHENPMSVAEIATVFGISPKAVEDDLQHLRKSLKKSAYRLKVHPAACRKCTFVFSPEKLSKPGKCPQCRGTWIEAPLVEISSNTPG
jgi:predicted Zn-ribbon and HTH transcriptional regulator